MASVVVTGDECKNETLNVNDAAVSLVSRPLNSTGSMWREGLLVQLLTNEGRLPEKKSNSAAGYDLFASEVITIPAWKRAKVPTKITVGLPPGVYGRIAPRSGLAINSSVDVVAGVVDPDYRGEIIVGLANMADEPYTVKAGDRIAQLILESCLLDIPVYKVSNVSEILGSTERGANGFGSSGK
jgi:dUTP pyrophosphatase